MAKPMVEQKQPPRLQHAPLGSYLVNVLSIIEAEIKNTESNSFGDSYYRVTYRVVRAKPDNGAIDILPGSIYGISMFKGKKPAKVNDDLARLYAAAKSADGDPTIDDEICVLKATRENPENAGKYKFSLEELLKSRYAPKAILLLKRLDVESEKANKDAFPRHEWSVPSPDTLAALEAAIAKAQARVAAAAAAAATAANAPVSTPPTTSTTGSSSEGTF